MQTKKETVQKAIVRAATKEFLEHGFEKSSMRRMAAEANTGMSNFYNYFKSKDDLFAYIVENRAVAIKTLFDRLLREDCAAAFNDITDYRMLLYNLRRWAGRFDILYSEETLLLLNSAVGTHYEPTRKTVIDSMSSLMIRLTAWDASAGLPDRYPLRHFVEQLLDDMIATGEKFRGRSDVKDILRNQLVTGVAGMYLMLR